MLTPKWCRSSLSAGTSQTTAGGTCFTSGMASPGTTASLSPQPTSLSRTRCSSIRGPGAAINRWPFRCAEPKSTPGARPHPSPVWTRSTTEQSRSSWPSPTSGSWPRWDSRLWPQHVLGDIAEDGEVDATEFALTSPIGTGPIPAGAPVPEGDAELVANPSYWGGSPQIDWLILRRLDDEEALLAFRTGRDRHHVHRRAGC